MTEERCAIRELSNTSNDPDVSIAEATVATGVTTSWHRLRAITERYVITQGTGQVELVSTSGDTVDGQAIAQSVGRGDVVIIPEGTGQRIRNTGNEQLVFLAICSPRFHNDCYEDIEHLVTARSK